MSNALGPKHITVELTRVETINVVEFARHGLTDRSVYRDQRDTTTTQSACKKLLKALKEGEMRYSRRPKGPPRWLKVCVYTFAALALLWTLLPWLG